MRLDEITKVVADIDEQELIEIGEAVSKFLGNLLPEYMQHATEEIKVHPGKDDQRSIIIRFQFDENVTGHAHSKLPDAKIPRDSRFPEREKSYIVRKIKENKSYITGMLEDNYDYEVTGWEMPYWEIRNHGMSGYVIIRVMPK